MTIEPLKIPSAEELDALTDLWEASVRATHDFLAPEDIVFFRQMVRQEALRGVELYVVREPDSKAPETGTSAGQESRHESRTSDRTGESCRPEGLDEHGMFGGFAAFAGIEGDMLEMLFVAPQARGKRLGRQMVEYLVRECGIRRVDVNEQNAQAAGFYARLGFRVTGRDATDPSGRPYPILHLSLDETPQRVAPIPNLQTDRADADFLSEGTGDEGK